MNKRILGLIALLGFGMQANATVIGFDPSSTNVGIGNEVSVDLVVSDLGDDILTAYDLEIAYDASLLAFNGFEFGTDCGGFSCLDVLGFGSIQDAFDFGGLISIFEVSFDFDIDLMDFQPNDFVLGTLSFTGLEFGTSPLLIDIVELAGEFVDDPVLGFPIAKDLDADIEDGQIEVPEPGIWLLMLSGLFGFSVMRKRQVVRS